MTNASVHLRQQMDRGFKPDQVWVCPLADAGGTELMYRHLFRLKLKDRRDRGIYPWQIEAFCFGLQEVGDETA